MEALGKNRVKHFGTLNFEMILRGYRKNGDDDDKWLYYCAYHKKRNITSGRDTGKYGFRIKIIDIQKKSMN